MTIEPLSAQYGSWHPGLESEIPREYLPLSTMFRIENVSTSISKAYELSDYCSLRPTELVAFRAERLVIHELLIHVTSTISVPDGGDYEDLGRNFREITSTILNRDERWRRLNILQGFRLLGCKSDTATARHSCPTTCRAPHARPLVGSYRTCLGSNSASRVRDRC